MTAPPAARLTRDAQELNRSIERLFESAAAQLFDQLDRMDALSALLQRAHGVAAGAGQQQFRQSVEEAGQTMTRIAETYTGLGEASTGLKRNVQTIALLLLDLKRDIRLAQMVATNAQVIVRSLPERQPALEHFASDVKTLLQTASESTQKVSAEMTTTDTDLGQLSQGISHLATTIAGLEGQRRNLPPLLQTLSGMTDLPQALRDATTAQGRIVTALRRAVADLQGGDAARQRLEHVIDMLAQPDSGDAVERLARAQLADTAATLGQELRDALAALQIIDEARGSAAQSVRVLGGSGIGLTLAQIAAVLGQLNAGLATLEEVTRALAPVITQLSAGYARGAASVEAIAGLDNEMHGLGINAILVARKIGADGQAMTEVARQLRECTARIGKGSLLVLDLARTQEQASARLVSDRGEGGSAAREHLAALEREIHGLAQAFRDTAEWSSSREMDAVAAIARQLQDMADRTRTVSDSAGADHPQPFGGVIDDRLRALLGAIRATYTMQSERAIHDALFPGLAVAPSPAAPPEPLSDPLEDILF